MTTTYCQINQVCILIVVLVFDQAPELQSFLKLRCAILTRYFTVKNQYNNSFLRNRNLCKKCHLYNKTNNFDFSLFLKPALCVEFFHLKLRST